jgi:hypothetical protein
LYAEIYNSQYLNKWWKVKTKLIWKTVNRI